ncbi:MAG: uracil-DNA glycosylase family protein [Dysgonamonadaceae bacterium]|jgi:G:T/U-mismatch repair DNA glycosylase|nr:uracil-DNA glycosylase family protein [Dysgonamonadaceae bacterium]
MGKNNDIPVEIHPLEPFLPYDAGLLMLGSFPPQRKRWSMRFYYPNLNNDMWRIMGIIFFDDREHFLHESGKAFCRDAIVQFLKEKRIALYDTATVIRRLNDNASDKFLDIVQSTDIKSLLDKIPECTNIAVTGQKATDILIRQLGISEPKIGEYIVFSYKDRAVHLWRMPSSSRAYPLKIERKAEIYRKMFDACRL